MVKAVIKAIILFLLSPIAANAELYPLLSITFEGNKSIASTRLKDQIRFSPEGGVYQPEVFKDDLANLEKFYREEGFINAVVGTPIVEWQDPTGSNRGARIKISISEGPQYAVGEIVVRDVYAFQPATLLRMCPLKAGQPYSRSKLSGWVDKIEDGYHTMGYLRFKANLKETLNDQRHLIDCTLECNEGRVYSVGTITIEGDSAIDRSDFKRHLLLSEGGLYNPELISLSVQFLNQMGKYQPFSDSNVEVKIDDTQAKVDLVFHITLPRGLRPGKEVQ